jgi:hypothetical protein
MEAPESLTLEITYEGVELVHRGLRRIVEQIAKPTTPSPSRALTSDEVGVDEIKTAARRRAPVLP